LQVYICTIINSYCIALTVY